MKKLLIYLKSLLIIKKGLVFGVFLRQKELFIYHIVNKKMIEIFIKTLKHKYSIMVKIKTIAVDVLKPHEPSIIELGKILCKHKLVSDVEIKVYAVDKKTESVRIIIEGEDLKYEEIEKIIEKESSVIHSIDMVNLKK